MSATEIELASYAAARAQLRDATATLRAAFGGLTLGTRPVFSPLISVRPAAAAQVGGLGARLTPVQTSVASLQATRRIYTHYTTERSSSEAIGLDQSAEVSRLLSAALGLDITSPAAPSRLISAEALGLDVTSPEAASVLRSVEALGLDLTSPDAASRLASALGLGLDVSSPETASVLRSGAALGLDVTSPERASTVQSTTEINQAATSYGSSELVLSGNGNPSTSTASLSGVYTGTGAAASASSLTLKITRNATLSTSATNVRFEIRNQANQLLFSFNGNLQAGDQVYLGDAIGLTVTFSAGTVTNNHTASTTVSHTPTDVDPDAAFNAPQDQRPRFENGAQVTAGSFTVNGTTIAVQANDTIQLVLARINASGAGVSASFANDRVTLTSTSNSEDAIVLAADTSGFLSAVKLSGAATVTGQVRDDRQVLAKTSQFASVATGTLTINGVSIQIDRDTDTLETVLARINGAGAGVTAAFDAAEDKVILTSTAASEALITVGGSSGFAAAARLATGDTERGNIRDDRQRLSNTTQFGGVLSGSFTINGATIAVDREADTLETVLARINDSAAGVTAVYDVGSDRLVLTGTSSSMDLIRVSNDTSGFLSAAHLDTANTVRGHLAEDGVSFENLAQFASVTNGSFAVDGRTIAVDVAADSIQSIVAKINASGARVVAGYDADADRLVLQATYDSEDDVPVGQDSSGLLAAAGLYSANTERGNLRDDLQVLSKTARFGGVTSGTFEIGGRSITLDVAVDSLQDVIARINGADAGVTARFDAGSNRIELVGTSDSEDLIDVGRDTTGLLAAALLDPSNTVRGNLRDDQQVLSKTTQFASVASGAFQVNGRSISVDVSRDTLEDVLGRINGAGAGVTASFDAASGRIELLADVVGDDLIRVDGDTTGLLGATGLSTGNTIRGKRTDDEQVLASTARFGEVTDGSFRVNGVTIEVRALDDTLQSIIAKINAAGAGVAARYDRASDALVVQTTDAGILTIDGDTSGLLAAARLAEGESGRRLNPDAAFNLTGADAPLFDPGLSVQAGRFAVNGVTIDVEADDSVASVLAKITASDARVTATFDATTERVSLVSRDPEVAVVAVGGDTSGFLAAVKLDQTAEARTETRAVSAFDTPLDRMAEYAGVRAGTLTVNGAGITIDPSLTTIGGLVSALNGVDGIVATLDDRTGRLQVSSREIGAALDVMDTSGLLDALGIAAGTYRHVDQVITTTEVLTGSTPVSNASRVADRVAAAVSTLNEALAALTSRQGNGTAATSDALGALRGAVASLERAGVEGLRVDTSGTAPRLVVDNTALARVLERVGASRDLAPVVATVLETLAERAAPAAAPRTAASAPAGPVGVALSPADLARRSADEAAVVLSAVPLLAERPEPREARTTAATGAGRSLWTLDDTDVFGRANPPAPLRGEATVARTTTPGVWQPPATGKPWTVEGSKRGFGRIPNEWPPPDPDPLGYDYLNPPEREDPLAGPDVLDPAALDKP